MNKNILIFVGAIAVGYFFADKLAGLPLVGKAYDTGANIG